MKLLVEYDQSLIVEPLTESVEGKKTYFLEGRWMTANEKNKNGRVYPGTVMEGALAKYDTEYIKTNRALGELNHPSGPVVNLDKASHKILNLQLEGNYVNGRAKIMDRTPMGAIVCALIDEGIRLGVSSRGLGTLKEARGFKEVQNDYWISAIDIVGDPSGGGCFPQGLIENVEYEMLDDGRLIQLVVDTKKKKISEEKAIKAFSELLEHIKAK